MHIKAARRMLVKLTPAADELQFGSAQIRRDRVNNRLIRGNVGIHPADGFGLEPLDRDGVAS